MADAITIKALQDASLDAKSLEEVVNGDAVTTVLSRLGETYPTLSNALNQIDSKLDSADTQIKQGITNLFQNGGLPATPFATKVLMEASALVDGDYAVVTDDTDNNGLYIKTAGAWVKSAYDPVLLATTEIANRPKLNLDTFYYTSEDKGKIKRMYKPMKFTKGKQYKISLSFNKDFKSSVNVSIAFKTLLSNNYLQAVDEIYSKEGLVKKQGQEVVFTATEDATYYYLYVNDATAGDLEIYVNIEEAVLLQEELNKPALSAILPRVYELYHNVNGRQRIAIKNDFIAGRTYTVTVQFDAVPHLVAGDITLYSFKTLFSDNNLDIVDDVLTLTQASIASKELRFSFTATADASRLYIYTSFNSNIRSKTSIVDETLLLENAAQLTTMYDNLKTLAEKNEAGLQYEGEKLNLFKNSYSQNTLMQLSKPSGVTQAFQGSAYYNGLLFACFHTGKVGVYDFANLNKTPITSFNLGSFGSDNHANCANFSGEFYSGNTQFPLLYVTGGNDGATMRCEVENITESGGVYSSTKVQSITFNQAGFAAAGLEEIWGWANWLVDSENGFIYAFSARYRTSLTEHYDDNIYIANKFRLPDPTIGDVTIGLSELVEQKVFEYNTYFTQSGCIFDNKIIYVFGLGNTQFPFNIRVYDLLTNSLSASIKVPVSNEPESCFIKDGKLFVVMVDGKVLEFSF